MSDWAIVILTAALVTITAYYAMQNKRMADQNTRMADEMRLAREASLRPHIVVRLVPLGPIYMMVSVTNVGTGPALDLDLTLRFQPRKGDLGPKDFRRWRADVLSPGESEEFMVPDGENGSMLGAEELSKRYASIEVTGGMKDALGVEHAVSSSVSELEEWYSLLVQAQQRYREPPEERLVDATKKAADALGKMVRQWSAGFNGLHIRTDQDLDDERASMKEHWERQQRVEVDFEEVVDEAPDLSGSSTLRATT